MIDRAHIVIGGGGHARVVIDALKRMGAPVLGIVDPKLKAGTSILEIPVLGGDEILTEHDPKQILLVNGIGSIGNNDARSQCFIRLKMAGFQFAVVQHPSAIIGEDCRMGEGTQVMAGVVLQPGVRVGENSILNTRCSIDHDCMIGNHVHIAPGVVLSGGVTVGDDVHIGTGACVIQGITIESGAFVGAGAVVTKNIKNNHKVYAAKARLIDARM